MVRAAIIYGVLVAGAALFSWPFIWMASSSAKLDREIFGDRNLAWPEWPIPREQSPYIDDRQFTEIDLPDESAALAIVREHLAAMDFPWPQDVEREKLLEHTARGVLQRLSAFVPPDEWERPPEQLQALIARHVQPQLVDNIVEQLRRSFGVGQFRARSYGLQEDLLVPPSEAAARWQLSGSAPASLVQTGTVDEPFAELHYDFSRGNNVVLTQTFTTSFPVERLHRLQMSLRYDNTWHAVQLFVEKNGRLLRGARTLEASDYNWVANSWQERGPDDRPDKIKTWTLLEEIDRGPQYVSGPNELKVTLELRQASQLGAWWSKIRRNYRFTLDYIPFWRYVGTSLFLVILNLVGTLFTCSLVAYSFARLRWPGRAVCFALMLATMMVPVQVTMIPQFLIMQKLGWYNTLTPLWIISFAAPAFYVFLLHQFLRGIPRDLEDAARLDGCGFWRIYWHIMLPLVKPTLAAIAIFTFVATWNEFMAPLIYLSDQRLYPLSFGLYAFQVQSTQPGTPAGMGMLMAGALLMTLPVIVIFFFAQRYFLQGVTLTGMKG